MNDLNELKREVRNLKAEMRLLSNNLLSLLEHSAKVEKILSHLSAWHLTRTGIDTESIWDESIPYDGSILKTSR